MSLRAMILRLIGRGVPEKPEYSTEVSPYSLSAFCYHCQRYWQCDSTPLAILERISLVLGHSKLKNHDVELELVTPQGTIAIKRNREREVVP